MKTANFDLRKKNDVLIIAEVGNNHEGDFTLAEELVGLAAKAGAGAVKFQTIVPERLVSIKETARIEQLKKFQFSYEQFAKLKKTADREGILFLSTPFDLESARFLNEIVPAFKIASGDNNFTPLIEEIAGFGKPIIMSSGLMTTQDLTIARDLITGIWKKNGAPVDQLAILHCIASYPAPLEDANLLAIQQLQKLGVVPGYSDHTLGIQAATMAAALGARVIEKHFTINKNHSAFRDHQLSADPTDLRELVLRVQDVRKMMGDGERIVAPCEKDNLPRMRRSIIAGRDLKAGTVLKMDDLSWVRPGNGLAPGRESAIVGKSLKKDIAFGDVILQDDIQ